MSEPLEGRPSAEPDASNGGPSGAAEGTRARSRLHRLLLDGGFVVTAELATTDSPDPASVAEHAEGLRDHVDAVNCTDNSSAHPHLSATAAAHLLLDAGVEPIVQFACRDRNRLGLQSDVLGAAALGARNVVLMTGDDVSAGDHPEAKPIYDIDAIHALAIVRTMRDDGTQTQICFNVEKLRLFMARAGDLGLLEHVWVIAGVFIPKSARGTWYLRDSVPGIDVPDDVVARMDGTPPERQAEEGLAMALEIVEEIRSIPGISGIHLMAIRNEEAILRLVEGAGLLPRPATASLEPAPR
jgi:methylenetetrahydrofolate reductase (NADPH)